MVTDQGPTLWQLYGLSAACDELRDEFRRADIASMGLSVVLLNY